MIYPFLLASSKYFLMSIRRRLLEASNSICRSDHHESRLSMLTTTTTNGSVSANECLGSRGLTTVNDFSEVMLMPLETSGAAAAVVSNIKPRKIRRKGRLARRSGVNNHSTLASSSNTESNELFDREREARPPNGSSDKLNYSMQKICISN